MVARMNRRHFLKTALAAPIAVVAPVVLLAEDRITRFWRSRALLPGFKRGEVTPKMVAREALNYAKPILHARVDQVRLIETQGKTVTIRRPKRYTVR